MYCIPRWRQCGQTALTMRPVLVHLTRERGRLSVKAFYIISFEIYSFFWANAVIRRTVAVTSDRSTISTGEWRYRQGMEMPPVRTPLPCNMDRAGICSAGNDDITLERDFTFHSKCFKEFYDIWMTNYGTVHNLHRGSVAQDRASLLGSSQVSPTVTSTAMP